MRSKAAKSRAISPGTSLLMTALCDALENRCDRWRGARHVRPRATVPDRLKALDNWSSPSTSAPFPRIPSGNSARPYLSTPRHSSPAGPCSPPCPIGWPRGHRVNRQMEPIDAQAEYGVRALPARTLDERRTAPARRSRCFNLTLRRRLPEYPHRDSCRQLTRDRYHPCPA